MKNLILTVGILLFISITAYSVQEEKEGLDTIIKVEGKVMPVDVIKVTTSYVTFKVKGESFRIARKEVHKIIYKNGRIEEYSPLALTMIEATSWKAVWLTEDKQDVTELHKRGVIKAQAPPNYRSSSAAKKNAIIRLQKKAAALQGQVVYVTKKHKTGGYGELQGYFIEGVVYGSEPLAEDFEEGN